MRAIVCRLGLVFALACLAPAVTAQPDSPTEECPDRLPEFEVEDQFKEKHTHEEFLGRVSILMWSDRKGSKFVDEWSEAIEGPLRAMIRNGSVQVRGWAHTKGVPFFIKGKVRGKFSKDPDAWSVLDWKGRLRKQFDPVEDSVNVFVFDAQGCLLAREHGTEVDQAKVDEILAAVLGLLVAD